MFLYLPHKILQHSWKLRKKVKSSFCLDVPYRIFFRFVQNLLTISSVMKRFQNRIIKIIQQSEPNKFLYDLLSLAWQVWLKGDNLLFELDILNLSQWEGDWIKILGHNDDLKLWIPKVVEKMVYQCFNVP